MLLSTASAQTLNERLITDAHDGRLHEFDFLSACLIAGGVSDECELCGWVELYKEREAALIAGLAPGETLVQLDNLRRELHSRFLRDAYCVEASDLRRVLGSGEHNCLSAVAVMFAIAQAAGLTVEIRLEKGHVHLQYARAGKRPVVIEPGAMDFTPPRNARAERVLSPTQLIGKFYYNRGVQLLKDERFAEGLELLTFSLQLDPDDTTARANLVAGINNWAAACCAKSNYARAAELIVLGLQLDPDFAPLVANERLVRVKLGAK